MYKDLLRKIRIIRQQLSEGEFDLELAFKLVLQAKSGKIEVKGDSMEENDMAGGGNHQLDKMWSTDGETLRKKMDLLDQKEYSEESEKRLKDFVLGDLKEFVQKIIGAPIEDVIGPEVQPVENKLVPSKPPPPRVIANLNETGFSASYTQLINFSLIIRSQMKTDPASEFALMTVEPNEADLGQNQAYVNSQNLFKSMTQISNCLNTKKISNQDFVVQMVSAWKNLYAQVQESLQFGKSMDKKMPNTGKKQLSACKTYEEFLEFYIVFALKYRRYLQMQTYLVSHPSGVFWGMCWNEDDAVASQSDFKGSFEYLTKQYEILIDDILPKNDIFEVARLSLLELVSDNLKRGIDDLMNSIVRLSIFYCLLVDQYLAQYAPLDNRKLEESDANNLRICLKMKNMGFTKVYDVKSKPKWVTKDSCEIAVKELRVHLESLKEKNADVELCFSDLYPDVISYQWPYRYEPAEKEAMGSTYKRICDTLINLCHTITYLLKSVQLVKDHQSASADTNLQFTKLADKVAEIFADVAITVYCMTDYERQ